MKRLISLLLAVILVISASFVAFAGTWEQSSAGWKWNNGDGTYAGSGWKWIDDNGDNKYQCFYFDKDGICFLNGTTPDGYTVNKDGAWTVDDVVQIITELGPSMTADEKATAQNSKESTGLDSYISKIEFSKPESYDKYCIHPNSKGNICVDLYLPANAKSMDYTAAMKLLLQSEKTIQKIANDALDFYNSSVDVVATMYTADGKAVVSKTFYGHP